MLLQQQFMDQLDYSAAIFTCHHKIGVTFQGRKRVTHGYCETTLTEKREIVFGVSDPNCLIEGKFESPQGRCEARCFIDAGGQKHQVALVQRDLEMHAELLHRVQNNLFVISRGSHDNLALRKRSYVLRLQHMNKPVRNGIAEKHLLSAGRIEKNCAVFRHDQIENVELGKYMH